MTSDETLIQQKLDTMRYTGFADHDPWGLDLDVCRKSLKILLPLYRNYFSVRLFGKERIPQNASVVASNHSGQIPIDGLLVTIAFFLESDPPILLRGMVERFMVKVPFLARWSTRSGSVLGDRKNCEYLLRNNQSILVFPEGARGVSKNSAEHYQLQPFTHGFLRMAIQTDAQILPIAVIGAEEMYPYVFHPRKLAKLLGLPALPLTPFFPLLGPLGALPLPSPIDIYVGEPIDLPPNLSTDSPEKQLRSTLALVRNQIRDMISLGLKKKRPQKEHIVQLINNWPTA